MSDKPVKQVLSDLQIVINRLMITMAEVEKIDLTWYFTINHTESGVSVHSGAGCAVCSIIRSVKWMVENQVKHESNIDEHEHMAVLVERVEKDNDDEPIH